MKTEDKAWRDLRDYAASRLPDNFADRVLRAVEGPSVETWQQLQLHAANQIRPGFAERVLRAARDFPAKVPSLFGQFALGAATVAVCLAAVFAVHSRTARLDEQIALAGWQQLAMEAQDLDHGL
ncbi:MAG: hypothetical protein ABIZ81_00275 [Opitutaceae bacterium]